jgi:tetratricopeptide (TPR) repeat protein
MLAAAYVNSDNYTGMEDLIPSLLQHAKGDAEIVNWIVAYAIFSKDFPDEGLVLKALDNLSDQEILLRDDTARLLSEVVARFTRTPGLENARSAILRKVIRGYEVDSKKWPANRRREVADAYGLEGEYDKAEPIYQAILQEIPNNVDALRGLGIVKFYQRKFKDAIMNLRKAWSLGDRMSLKTLAAAHVGMKDYAGMKDLVPGFLERRGEDPEILNSVLLYALKTDPPDKDLFFKAMKGVTDDEILRRDDTTELVVMGLKRFGQKARAERLLKLHNEQTKGKKA